MRSRLPVELYSIGPTIFFLLPIGSLDITRSGFMAISLLVSRLLYFWRGPLVRLTWNDILGITVGFVVIPQSMAYAKLAELAPEFGLYSSFMGVLIYWFFATSKDITIGVSTSLERTFHPKD